MNKILAGDVGKKCAVGRKEHKLEPRGKIHGINSWTNHSVFIIAEDQLYGMLAFSSDLFWNVFDSALWFSSIAIL